MDLDFGRDRTDWAGLEADEQDVLLQRDESGHIAYGVHLLTRLIRGDAALAGVFHARMEVLLPLATATISELFAAYDPMPFGLQEEDFIQFAMDQFGMGAANHGRRTALTVASRTGSVHGERFKFRLHV